MLIDKMKLYDSFPRSIKDMVGFLLRRTSYFKWAPTKEEEIYHHELTESQWLPADELKAIQLRKLSKILNYAYEHVPYYRMVFKERGIEPKDIDSIDALKTIPLLTKDIMRSNPEGFLSDEVREENKLTTIATGGSTGTPMKFLFDNHMIGVRRAHWWRWTDFAKIDLYNDRMVYCGGAPHRWVYPPDKSRGVVSLTRDKLFLSSANMADHVLDWYIEDIQRFKGDYIRGYSSGIYMLASRLLNNNLVIPMKAVLTSSDTLFPQYRSVIEEAFQCKVFDHYGQNEDSLTATECGMGGLHINVESCIAETVDLEGNIVSDGEGRLVSTHLENRVTPLIRYVTGDVGKVDWSWQKCSCGRSLQKIISFEGRADEIIVAPDGRRVGCGSMNQPMKTMYSSVKCCQFIQEKLDLLRIKVVPTDSWDDSVHRKELEQNTRRQVGDSIAIQIELVDQIPTRPNGKYQFIVSKIKADQQ